jgi:5-methylcytosine-specific restriction endonuclease McrA
MPRRPPTPCSTPGCDQLLDLGQRCPVHYVPWAGSTRRKRLPRNWPQIRRRVLTRDAHLCYLCGGHATDVDHVVRGDDHDPSNLAAICRTCHNRKSGREGNAARNAKRSPQ